MSEWTNEWMHGLMHEWMNGRNKWMIDMNQLTNEWTNQWMNETNEWMKWNDMTRSKIR